MYVNWSSVPSSSGQGGAWLVYALLDPRDESVRYVGITNHPMEHRLASHIRSPTSRRMRAWFDELAEQGASPVCRLLSGCNDKWEQAERGWIAWFRKRGDLLNIDPGGNCRDKHGNLISEKKHRLDPWRFHRSSKASKLAEISKRQMSRK